MTTKRLASLLGRRGIRTWLAIATIPLTLLGALAIGLVTAALSTKEVALYHIRAGEQMTANLAQRSDLALLYMSSASVADTAKSLMGNPLVKEVRVIEKGGSVLFARSVGDNRAWPYPDAPIEGTATAELDDVWLFSRLVRTAAPASMDSALPEAALLGNTGNEILGEVQLALSKDALLKARRSIFFGNLFTALGFSLLVVIATLLMLRWFSRPLEALADAMHETRSGHWTDPEPLVGPREVREIGDSYGALMKTLRLREEQLRDFNQDLEERIRRRTHALETSNKELEAFSYSVSHDLRAPLRAINGFGKALLEDYGESLDALAHNYVQRICDGAERMSELIDDMLKLSRVTRFDMQLARVDMSHMAEVVASEMREQFPNHPVDFQVTPGMQVQADPTLLRIMLDNLLSNAWKYTGRVKAPRVQFDRVGSDKEPVYVVRDNGAGFDMRFADKLFGAFQRLHGREFEGTGVGLAIVQRVLARHGGRAWAEAEVDKGASFFFTLPD
jgi:signal transduction histidine kinase